MTHKDECKHFVDDRKKREERTKKKGNGVELQQTTLQSIVERCKSYSTDHPRAKAITNRVAGMMATDRQPFSIVSDVGFCRLLAELEPRYASTLFRSSYTRNACKSQEKNFRDFEFCQLH